MPDNNTKYDLEERTSKFAEAILELAKKIPERPRNKPLIEQLVSAGTSIGANYCEADDAFSRKEFIFKISICKKESRETKYWLRLVPIAEPSLGEEAKTLLQEAKELHLIFAAIWRKK